VRQAILDGAGDLRLEEKELDPGLLEPDQIYVETLVSALSTGTDLGNYAGDSEYVPGAPPYPRAVGYSNVGRVVRVGSDVRVVTAGARIFALKPHQSAYIARESETLAPVPDGVRSEEASLAYLAQLGLAALQQAHCEPDDRVTVIGLGVIGLCTVAVAKMLGARVTAVANSAIRAEAARRLGADAVEGGTAADIVVLTANQWGAFRTAVEVAAPGGRIAILGFPGRGQPPPDFNPLDPRWLYAKQLSLIGAGRPPRGCDVAGNLAFLLEQMGAGNLRLESIISHRLPAGRMREAYELARAHDKHLLAAVFLWQEVS
jgi:threonine dehydrogenase-like Zn-dependent dehydrogenase